MVKIKKESIDLLAQQIDMCRKMTSNNPQVRKKGLNDLKKHLSGDKCSQITEKNMEVIWKGLFTYVWMSDMPLVQEADVEMISGIVNSIKEFDVAVLFVREFYRSISNEWHRISHFRIDKFLMFMRRFLRQILIFLKNNDWDESKVESISDELYLALQSLPHELVIHMCDIFNEEVAKISGGKISTRILVKLYKCFLDCMMNGMKIKSSICHINSAVFSSLVRQYKIYLAITEAEALEADSNAIKKEPFDYANMDPRPGNANVYLPYIEFDENVFIEYMEDQLKNRDNMTIKSRNVIKSLISMFGSMEKFRKTVKQPERVTYELNASKKRKIFPENFNSIIKKSCKKLEEESDDFELPLKKIRKLDRLMKPNNKSLTRANTLGNSWTVIDKNDDPSFTKPIKTPLKETNTENKWTVIENDSPECVSNNKSVTKTTFDWNVIEEESTNAKSTEPEINEGDHDQSLLSQNNKSVVNKSTASDWSICLIEEECEIITSVLDDTVVTNKETSIIKSPESIAAKSLNVESDAGKAVLNESHANSADEVVIKSESNASTAETVTESESSESSSTTITNVDNNESLNAKGIIETKETENVISPVGDTDQELVESENTEIVDNNGDTKSLTKGKVEISSVVNSVHELEKSKNDSDDDEETVTDEEDQINEHNSKMDKVKNDSLSKSLIRSLCATEERRNSLTKKRVSFCPTPEQVVLFDKKLAANSIRKNLNYDIDVPASAVKNRPKLLLRKKKYSLLDFSDKNTDMDSSMQEIISKVDDKNTTLPEPDWVCTTPNSSPIKREQSPTNSPKSTAKKISDVVNVDNKNGNASSTPKSTPGKKQKIAICDVVNVDDKNENKDMSSTPKSTPGKKRKIYINDVVNVDDKNENENVSLSPKSTPENKQKIANSDVGNTEDENEKEDVSTSPKSTPGKKRRVINKPKKMTKRSLKESNTEENQIEMCVSDNSDEKMMDTKNDADNETVTESAAKNNKSTPAKKGRINNTPKKTPKKMKTVQDVDDQNEVEKIISGVHDGEENIDDEMDDSSDEDYSDTELYDGLGNLFKTPPKKRARKSARYSIDPSMIKRSARIAKLNASRGA